MGEDPVLLTARVDGIIELTLNRPARLNALDEELFDSLVSALTALLDDQDARVIILTGAGRAFCAGLDLETFRTFAAEADAGERPFGSPGEVGTGKREPGRGRRVVQTLRKMPVPVIAAIHGAAIGGGCQIALGCDIRLATADAKLALREADYGMSPDMGGTQLLPRLIGSDRALEMIVTGRIVSGAEAATLGLVTRVCDDPLSEARRLAAEIVARSPDAVDGSKRLVRLSDSVTVEAGMDAELQFMSRNIGSANQSEAARARLEQRSAAFVARSTELPDIGF